MSYGIYNSRIGADVNAIEYVWDPSKQTSSFVKALSLINLGFFEGLLIVIDLSRSTA